MRTPRPILANSHRLARLVTWLKLWLGWAVVAFGAWMEAGERHERRGLDKIARFACQLAFYTACARVRPCWRRAKHRHGRLQRLTRRTAIGARLRKSVRGADFPSRLHAILCFVRDLEAHIAHAAARLTRRLHAPAHSLSDAGAPDRAHAHAGVRDRACGYLVGQ